MSTLKKLILSSSTLFVLAACGGDTEDPAVEEVPEDTTEQTGDETNEQIAADDLELITEADLAEYDGKEGNPAYVAVDDVIYDVSEANGWEDGVHEGGIEAGNAYTEDDFEGSPHGTEVMDNAPIVGTIDRAE